jgi:NADH-quinone oxidoreductase subunit E
METNTKQDALSSARAAVAQHGSLPGELIPILNDINHEIGYLPDIALAEVGRLLQIPRSKLFSVASFYSMFSMTPRGAHIIQFCESAPCHVVGGREVWQALVSHLNLNPGEPSTVGVHRRQVAGSGETSQDRKWTLITTSCLGVCAVGPVVIVDDDIYGNVTPDQIAGILAHYQ